MPRAKTHAEQLVQHELKSLRKKFEAGWDYLHWEIQHALLYERVLCIMLGQAKSIDPARVVEFTHELAKAARDALDPEGQR